jgi:hypothetical protein
VFEPKVGDTNALDAAVATTGAWRDALAKARRGDQGGRQGRDERPPGRDRGRPHPSGRAQDRQAVAPSREAHPRSGPPKRAVSVSLRLCPVRLPLGWGILTSSLQPRLSRPLEPPIRGRNIGGFHVG